MQQEIDIMVAGRPVRKIAHNGKIFVVAKEGSEYEIRVKNNDTKRVLGVCSVDGLNVIDGKEADTEGAGYIIHGYGSYTVRGFRTSNDEVHPFVFNKKDKSYAAESEETGGDTKNCGVIGVIFHAEKIKTPKKTPKVTIIREKEYVPYIPHVPWASPYIRPYRWPEVWCESTTAYCSSLSNDFNSSAVTRSTSITPNIIASASTSNTSAMPISSETLDGGAFDLGTEFSDEVVTDKVTNTSFDIDYTLGAIEIYYASREQLIAMGVPVDKENSVAFPSAFKSTGFCKVPRRKK